MSGLDKGQLLLADMQPRVLQTRAGITVDNGNTNAEGRSVCVDCDMCQLAALPCEWIYQRNAMADMQVRVLQMRAGITVENGNTDAEGRLVCVECDMYQLVALPRGWMCGLSKDSSCPTCSHVCIDACWHHSREWQH
jgi:hypothetical protein